MNEFWTPHEVKITNDGLAFEWQHAMERREGLEDRARKLIESAKSYLRSILPDYPFPKKYDVILGRRRSHANLGAEMHLSASRLIDFEDADQFGRDVEQSLIIHELVHNLRDDEDLPMLVELTYMLEHDGSARLIELKEKLQNDKLDTQYVDGLKRIAEWLGYQDAMDFLASISPEDVVRMKDIFQKRIKVVLEELAQQVSTGEASVSE